MYGNRVGYSTPLHATELRQYRPGYRDVFVRRDVRAVAIAIFNADDAAVGPYVFAARLCRSYVRVFLSSQPSGPVPASASVSSCSSAEPPVLPIMEEEKGTE